MFALGVASRWGGGGGGEGGGMAQYIFTIRKQHTVNKGTRVQGNGSEYFRGVVFSYSFSIYCAAYHGIWCSVIPKNTIKNRNIALNQHFIFFCHCFLNKCSINICSIITYISKFIIENN